MDKRYQVFVSSTFADLKEERQRVILTLMEMDCIPSGMELFPAADEEQFEFIKKVIDDCDYYILIIGGRYGSVANDGFSYTEKEYDYALERKIKVLAFLHEDPSQIPMGKSESDAVLRERLRVFREKVKTGRLINSWKTADQLPGLVALSLSKTIKTYPAVGWVRGDKTSSEETLSEINELRKENAQLNKTLKVYTDQKKITITNLAGLDHKFTFIIGYSKGLTVDQISVTMTWREIFSLIAPYLLKQPNDAQVEIYIRDSLGDMHSLPHVHTKFKTQDFQTMKIQLVALELVETPLLETTQGSLAVFWKLTPEGQRLMMQLRTIKA